GTFSAYERRYGPVKPEYILIDTELNSNAPWARTVQQTYGDRLGDEYGLIKYQDGVQVFERGYDGPVSGITQPEPSPRVYDAADLAIDTGEYENGRIVSTNGSEGDYIWFGPYDTLTTGNYTATFRVNVSGTGSEPVVMVGVAGGQDHARIASKQVTPKNGWQNVTVPFTLDETT